MRGFALEFLRRGLIACGFGPFILAVLYLILHQTAAVQTLTVNQVCIGIFSTAALAFVAGGMNVIYQIERLPLMVAILIHGVILYISYLATYLLNDWLDFGVISMIVFSAIFVVGYVVIWAIVYAFIKTNTEKLNKLLQKNNRNHTQL